MTGFIFVVFGITGDLAKRKIIPAIYNLVKKNKIKKFALIGAAIEEKTIEEIFAAAKEFIQNIDEEAWKYLISRSTYLQLDVTKFKEFKKLKDLILNKEKEYNLSGSRLFYCAVASNYFIDITKNLVKSGIMKKIDNKVWNRIVYEKPFGNNLESAKKINRTIAKFINESQIFRVDHYLAKEIVDNIIFLRFTNRIFEPLWNRNQIESVQIIMNEKVCLENRATYYDQYGTFRDMVQNHMLQLLSLVTMEPPEKLIGDYIRDSKALILKKVVPVDGILGQYEGYSQEPGVSNNSKTETFVALKLFINDKRWKNVPFYLKTGKCLKRKETKICIKFKNANCLLMSKCPIEPNYLTISIYPQEGIIIELYTKKPNTKDEITKATMTFCYDCLFVPGAYEAYESIIMDVIQGNYSVSVRQDEIEYSWKIIDKFKEFNLPLYKYQKGSDGPIEADEFALKNDFEWK